MIIVAAAAAACTSPEAERSVGGGPGADTGNRGTVVMMHEGSKPFVDTPRLVEQSAPLDEAQQAHRMSVR